MPLFAPSEPFVPAAGLANAHAQTIAGAFLRSPRAPRLRRERWDLPDTDFIDVDILDAPPSAPHILVLHGLEGSAKSGYVLEVLRGAAERGWGAYALNFRSCSGEPNRLPRAYHSGETEDARYALRRLRDRTRGPLLAMGFSLGGNVIMKLVAEDADASPLASAVAVSTPFDLAACARSLDTTKSATAIYRRVFLLSLRAKALSKDRSHPGLIDVAGLRSARGIAAFDEAVTARLFGFESAADYYAKSSSGPMLSKIRRPCLAINAKDDPMVPPETLPDVDANPNVSWLRSGRGGHVGFIAGSVLRPRFWAEREGLQFLEKHAVT